MIFNTDLFISIFNSVINFLLKEFFIWISLWKKTFDIQVIWITLPVYIVWLTTEYFQEKKETSYGNAATNGVLAVWVSIDWLRQMYLYLGINYYKLSIILLNLFYGLFITYLAIKQNPLAKKIGRIKDISYLQVIVTPIMYNLVPLKLEYFISIFLFFPIVHIGTNYIIDRYLPEPFKLAGEGLRYSSKKIEDFLNEASKNMFNFTEQKKDKELKNIDESNILKNNKDNIRIENENIEYTIPPQNKQNTPKKYDIINYWNSWYRQNIYFKKNKK